MEELFNLEINENMISQMVEINPYIRNIEKEDVIEKEELLRNIGCNNSEIVNIISNNPLCFNRTNNDIFQIINYLKNLGINNIELLLNSNPFILNLDLFEIEDYIENRKNNNELIENIIDDIENNPFLLTENI